VANIDLWPISTLPVADIVFCVADMVVADIDVIPLSNAFFLVSQYVENKSRKSLLEALLRELKNQDTLLLPIVDQFSKSFYRQTQQ